MSQLSDKQLKELIRQAGDQFSLSAGHKTAMRFHLMDVIKSDQTRIYNHQMSHISNSRRFVMPLVPIIIALVIALGGGTATLANSAKPGDALYPIDQWVERMQERFSTNTEARVKLLARFADERVTELASLENVDVAALTDTAEQKWEEHRQEAIDRVTTSIARVSANQDKFEEWLAAETNPDQKAIWQKIIAHLDEVKAKREARLNALKDKTFPGLQRRGLKEALEQAREEHKQEIEQIREQVKQEWEALRESNKQESEEINEDTTNSSADDNEDADNDENDDNSVEDSSSNATQTTLEMRVPRDENGNIDFDLIDRDKDGIPDYRDKYPDWGPHTMGA